jgi:hypothetical protein
MTSILYADGISSDAILIGAVPPTRTCASLRSGEVTAVMGGWFAERVVHVHGQGGKALIGDVCCEARRTVGVGNVGSSEDLAQHLADRAQQSGFNTTLVTLDGLA